MNRQQHSVTSDKHDTVPVVSFREACRTWCRVAALSFGGSAGQIAVMHRIVVDEKRWLSEDRFLHALNYCMLLPGPEAQQLATYIGWLMHGVRGGLVAGTLFILPGFFSILVLSVLYAEYQQTTLVAALFFGLKPAVMAIVVEAVIRIGKRVLKNRGYVAVAGLSFAAITLGVPFPVLVLSAGVIGLIGGRVWPELFSGGAEQGTTRVPERMENADADSSSAPLPRSSPLNQVNTESDAACGGKGEKGASLWRRSLIVSAVCLTLWFGPLAALWFRFGSDSVYVQEGIFFSKAAMVTFGGAYAALAYVAQQAIERHGWLLPGEMLDGLGMAETTPGPLIIVVQFVGFLGAYRQPGPLGPVAGGVLGSVVTVWATFAPCFLWIFLGAPYVERLRGNRAMNSALSAITAAVVGVVLNLAVWFSIHTLFRTVETIGRNGLTVEVPVFSSFDWRTGSVALLAFVLTFVAGRGMAVTLSVCVLVGAALYAVT